MLKKLGKDDLAEINSIHAYLVTLCKQAEAILSIKDMIDGGLFEYAYPFHNGIAKVEKEGMFNFIKKGEQKLLCDSWFDLSSDFKKEDGSIKALVQKNGSYFYINTDGNPY